MDELQKKTIEVQSVSAQMELGNLLKRNMTRMPITQVNKEIDETNLYVSFENKDRFVNQNKF